MRGCAEGAIYMTKQHLQELADKMIALENKLSDPNETSFTIEVDDLDKVAKILSDIGYVSKYTPTKIFVQAYLPCYASVDAIESILWHYKIYDAKVSRLEPGRVRCFPVQKARETFAKFYSNFFSEPLDLVGAKETAILKEYDSGLNFAASERFEIPAA